MPAKFRYFEEVGQLKGGGERKIKIKEKYKRNLEIAQESSRRFRKRKAEKTFRETRLINGGRFHIIKCAEFGIERTTKKRTNSSAPKSTNIPAGRMPNSTKINATKPSSWWGCLQMKKS